MHLTNAAAGTSTLQILANYLSELVLPTTAAQLAQENDTFLNPPPTTDTVLQGKVAQQSNGQVTDTFGPTQRLGAVVNGPASVIYNGVKVKPLNILVAEGTIMYDKINNVQKLESGEGSTTMTAAQFNSFSDITTAYSGISSAIGIDGGGTVSLLSSNVDPNAESNSLFAEGWEGTNLTGGGWVVASKYGNDTLTSAGTGGRIDTGMGIDTIKGGINTSIFVDYGLAAGSSIQGGTNNVLIAAGDISHGVVTNITTLEINNDYLFAFPTGAVTLTGAQFNSFSNIYNLIPINDRGVATDLTFTNGGAYDINTKIPAGTTIAQINQNYAINLTATSTNGTKLIGDDADANILTASQQGNDTLQAGNGNGDQLYGGGGNDTLIAGIGADTLYGGSGYMRYQFGASFGQDLVNNAAGGNTIAGGEVDFTSSSVTDEKLWFVKNGSDLVVDRLGSIDQITISNWFGSAGAEVQSFNAGGLKLDTQVAQLAQAMATYQSAHPGFNPVTATAMPTDTTLQHVILAAWHK